MVKHAVCQLEQEIDYVSPNSIRRGCRLENSGEHATMPLRAIVAVVVALVLSSATPQAEPVLSSKVAVAIAKAIADYTGYTRTASRIMDFEVVDLENSPAYDGYVTVQIMANAHPIFNVSINKVSGQAADFLGCYVLAYPVVEETEHKEGFYGHGNLSYNRMLGDQGCDSYQVFKKPNDDGRNRPRISTGN